MIYQHENMDVERDMQLLRRPWEALRFPRLRKNSGIWPVENMETEQQYKPWENHRKMVI